MTRRTTSADHTENPTVRELRKRAGSGARLRRRSTSEAPEDRHNASLTTLTQHLQFLSPWTFDKSRYLAVYRFFEAIVPQLVEVSVSPEDWLDIPIGGLSDSERAKFEKYKPFFKEACQVLDKLENSKEKFEDFVTAVRAEVIPVAGGDDSEKARVRADVEAFVFKHISNGFREDSEGTTHLV